MVGQTLGRYQVIRELSRDGIAITFLAWDPTFSRQVAVKVIPPQFAFEPHFRVRFQREAKVITVLEHSYIVPVYDFGEEEDQPFIVMGYMPGGTLADRIAGKPMPLLEIVPLMGRLAEALDEAHSQNVIHRDLKPSNVLFDAHGDAFLSDFGIANMLQAAIALTGSRVAGTPAYMSPEQAAGAGFVDRRSDIYSLGLILYEMLAGRPPYEADTPISPIWLMRQHVNEPVPQLAAEEMTRLVLPPECNPILARALAKKPEDRYPTAGALAEAVRALSAMTLPDAVRPLAPIADGALWAEAASSPPMHTAPTAPAVMQPTRPTLRLSRRLWLMGGARLATLGALAGLAVVLSVTRGSEPTPTRISTRPTASFVTAAPSITAAAPATELLATVAVVVPSRTQTSSPSPSSTATVTPSPPPDTPTITVSPTVTRRPATRVPPTSTPLPPPADTPLPQPTALPQPPQDTAAAPPTPTAPVEPPTSTPPPPP